MVSDRLPAGLAAAIAQAIRRAPTRITPLGGGCVSHVSKVEFDGHPPLVIKTAAPAAALALEADMLRHLAGHSQLPVPDVVQVDERFLLTSFIDTAGRLDTAAEHEAATLIAALHKVEGPAFGFAYDTLIGGLHQTNLWTPSWREFFQDHRLLYMASQAHDAEWLPNLVLDRINRLAGRIERWIDGTATPSLLHGDLWLGNILVGRGRIAGFIDPAIYYGDREIELAFATLFDSLGNAFFDRYRELRPLAPGFFEERRDLYNLYPLLVHVRLFGGAYVGQVERTLTRFGC